MILATLTAAIDAAGTLNTFYASDSVFITSPSDTPAGIAFIPSMMDPGSLGLHVFSDGRTGGGTSLETGEMILANADGQYDSWLNYSFDGRPITIYQGNDGAAFPSGFTKLFTGTIDGVEFDWEKVIVRLRDKQYIFSLPLLTTKYAGSNSLPNGLEGTPNDIKDKVKPRVYGKVFNITPSFVNTSKLTYQVSDGAVNTISAVYDKGLALTVGADFANSTLLQAAIPAAGAFITCIAEGYFRLGSSPAGTITADVTQGAAAGNRTVAQIVKSIGLSAGLSAGEISSADVTAMDTANSNVVGVYVNDETVFQDVIDQLLNSIGAYCGFDSTGVLRMGILTTPSGTPVVTLQEFDAKGQIDRIKPKDNGIPVYRVKLNHTKIYTVQSTDLAGAITDATKAYLQEEYRSTKSEDTSIKTQWLLAKEYEQNTLLTSASDAFTEAARQLALYKVRRDIYEITVDSSIFTANNLKFTDLIQVQVPRFGMTGGKLFRLIGIRYELMKNNIVLQVWG